MALVAARRAPEAPMPTPMPTPDPYTDPANDEGAAPREATPLDMPGSPTWARVRDTELPTQVTMTGEPQQLPFLACPGGQKPPPLFLGVAPVGSMTTAPEGVYTAQPDRAAAVRRMTNAFTIDSARGFWVKAVCGIQVTFGLGWPHRA
jgi:hypothetical protein